MRTTLLTIGLAVLATLVIVDTASAGLFGFRQRRWERQKAELRWEIGQQMSAKIDRDLEQQMSEATEKLQAEAAANVAAETSRLGAEIQRQLAELKQQAAEMVAAEAKKLDSQVQLHVQQLRDEARKTVADEVQRLEKQVQQSVTLLRTEVAEDAKKMQVQLQTELERLTEQARQQPAPGDSSQDENRKGPAGTLSNQSALPATKPELVDGDAERKTN